MLRTRFLLKNYPYLLEEILFFFFKELGNFCSTNVDFICSIFIINYRLANVGKTMYNINMSIFISTIGVWLRSLPVKPPYSTIKNKES